MRKLIALSIARIGIALIVISLEIDSVVAEPLFKGIQDGFRDLEVTDEKTNKH